MPRVSAGLLLYRLREGRLEVLLVHPGGPFWARKDAGAWTIPKGLVEDGEEAQAAALREFAEETGLPPPAGPLRPLAPIHQKGGKMVQAWAAQGDCDPAQVRSNVFRMEYPPGSGRWREVPEIDRAAFFSVEEAKTRLNPAQVPLVEELARTLAGPLKAGDV